MLTSHFFRVFTEANRPFQKMDIFKNVQNAFLKNKRQNSMILVRYFYAKLYTEHGIIELEMKFAAVGVGGNVFCPGVRLLDNIGGRILFFELLFGDG